MYRVLFANYGKSVLLNKTCLKELNTSTDTFDEIVREVFEDDKMINAQKVLDTNYTRNKLYSFLEPMRKHTIPSD